MNDTDTGNNSQGFEAPEEFKAAATVFGGQQTPQRGLTPKLGQIRVEPKGHTPPTNTPTEPPPPKQAPKQAKRKPTKPSTTQTGTARINFVLPEPLVSTWDREAAALDLYKTDYFRAAIALHAQDLEAPPDKAPSFARRQTQSSTPTPRSIRLPASELKHLDTAATRTKQSRSWVIRECLRRATADRETLDAFLLTQQ